MHGPTCVFWAKLTPFSLKYANPPAGSSAADAARDTEMLRLWATVATGDTVILRYGWLSLAVIP